MLTREELRQRLEALAPTVDAPRVERALQELQRQGEDEGGGIEASAWPTTCWPACWVILVSRHH